MGAFKAYEGQEVQQIWIWAGQVRLVFDIGVGPERAVYIDVGEFEFTDAEGTLTYVDVDRDPRSACPVLGLLRQRVTKAAVESWVLSLHFDNGSRLICRPDERYEAWTAVLPGDAGTWFCPPGGGSDSPS